MRLGEGILVASSRFPGVWLLLRPALEIMRKRLIVSTDVSQALLRISSYVLRL